MPENENVTPITEEPQVEETTTEEAKHISPKDYKMMMDLMKEMNEQYTMVKDTVESFITNTYGLNKEVITNIAEISDEEIEAYTCEDLKDFFTKNGSEENTAKYYENNMIAGSSEYEVFHKAIVDIKKESTDIFNMKAEMDRTKAEGDEIIKDYLNYMASPAAEEARNKRLLAMKDALEKETDESKKKEMEKMISAIENSHNLSFLYSRFDKFGQGEIDSIMDCFFQEKRGAYVINRFRTHMGRFGFDPEIYKYFFNLEENFLPEEYHVYNNLFLFIFMRHVAYADSHDKVSTLYVQSIVSAMANLVYHRFPNTENEKTFIEVMKNIEDKFSGNYGYFEANNTTQPNHPVRLKKAAEHEARRKESLIAKMDEMKITGYDAEASADDLQKYMNDKVEEIVDAQKTKYENGDSVKVTGTEDNVTIEPSMIETPEVVEAVETNDEVADAEIVSSEVQRYDSHGYPIKNYKLSTEA